MHERIRSRPALEGQFGQGPAAVGREHRLVASGRGQRQHLASERPECLRFARLAQEDLEVVAPRDPPAPGQRHERRDLARMNLARSLEPPARRLPFADLPAAIAQQHRRACRDAPHPPAGEAPALLLRGRDGLALLAGVERHDLEHALVAGDDEAGAPRVERRRQDAGRRVQVAAQRLASEGPDLDAARVVARDQELARGVRRQPVDPGRMPAWEATPAAVGLGDDDLPIGPQREPPAGQPESARGVHVKGAGLGPAPDARADVARRPAPALTQVADRPDHVLSAVAAEVADRARAPARVEAPGNDLAEARARHQLAALGLNAERVDGVCGLEPRQALDDLAARDVPHEDFAAPPAARQPPVGQKQARLDEPLVPLEPLHQRAGVGVPDEQRAIGRARDELAAVGREGQAGDAREVARRAWRGGRPWASGGRAGRLRAAGVRGAKGCRRHRTRAQGGEGRGALPSRLCLAKPP